MSKILDKERFTAKKYLVRQDNGVQTDLHD